MVYISNNLKELTKINKIIVNDIGLDVFLMSDKLSIIDGTMLYSGVPLIMDKSQKSPIKFEYLDGKED